MPSAGPADWMYVVCNGHDCVGLLVPHAMQMGCSGPFDASTVVRLRVWRDRCPIVLGPVPCRCSVGWVGTGALFFLVSTWGRTPHWLATHTSLCLRPGASQLVAIGHTQLSTALSAQGHPDSHLHPWRQLHSGPHTSIHVGEVPQSMSAVCFPCWLCMVWCLVFPVTACTGCVADGSGWPVWLMILVGCMQRAPCSVTFSGSCLFWVSRFSLPCESGCVADGFGWLHAQGYSSLPPPGALGLVRVLASI